MKLCTDRELRIKLFCVVFSIEPERKGEGANSSTAGAGRGRKGRSASTALGRDEAEDVGRSNKLSKREEVERRQRAAGVIRPPRPRARARARARRPSARAPGARGGRARGPRGPS